MGSSPKCVHATMARMVNKKMAARVARPVWTVAWSAKTTQARFGMDLARGLKRTDVAMRQNRDVLKKIREKRCRLSCRRDEWVGTRHRPEYDSTTSQHRVVGLRGGGGIVLICVRWNILTYVWKLSQETSAKLCYLAEWKTRWSPVCWHQGGRTEAQADVSIDFYFCLSA